MFSLTTSRALLIAGLNIACQVASFSPSTPFSARNQLPAETLLSTPSKVPRGLKTQLAGRKSKIRKAVKDLFGVGVAPSWYGVYPPLSPHNFDLFTLGIAHKRHYKHGSSHPFKNLYSPKTEVRLTAARLGNVVSAPPGLWPNGLPTPIADNLGPYRPQSLWMTTANEGGARAMIGDIGVNLGGGHGRVTDVFGLRRKERSLNAPNQPRTGEAELLRILKLDDVGGNGQGGNQDIRRHVRDTTLDQEANKIVVVTDLIIADLAASTGSNTVATLPLLTGPQGICLGFDFNRASYLTSSSIEKIVLVRFVGWNYKTHEPLSSGTFEII